MCRLFGLTANKEVGVIFSMLQASNRFKNQGKANPHGWGFGWYEKEVPKVEKYGESAFFSNRFDERVKKIKSKIIIAHVRLATSGSSDSDSNAHPFIYNQWIFAHNGTVNKKKILKLLRDPYNQNFTSEPIDSEVYFRYLIQCIDEKGDKIEGIKTAVNEVVKSSGGANFLLSDGLKFYAFRYGRELYFLERDPLSPFSCSSNETYETYALIESKKLANEKAILIATEKLTEDEKWKELLDGELLVINENLEIRREVLV